jgi:hypothetical protein
VFPGAQVVASAAPSTDGRTLAVSARADLSLARALHGTATLETASLAPLTAEVHAKDVAVGELTLLVPMLPAGHASLVRDTAERRTSSSPRSEYGGTGGNPRQAHARPLGSSPG